jgi:hypothetical protein
MPLTVSHLVRLAAVWKPADVGNAPQVPGGAGHGKEDRVEGLGEEEEEEEDVEEEGEQSYSSSFGSASSASRASKRPEVRVGPAKRGPLEQSQGSGVFDYGMLSGIDASMRASQNLYRQQLAAMRSHLTQLRLGAEEAGAAALGYRCVAVTRRGGSTPPPPMVPSPYSLHCLVQVCEP